MKQGIYKIISNRPLTDTVFQMVLEGDVSHIKNSGEFINIKLEGKYLRRPISVCDVDATTVTIVYKVVGGGTEQMSEMPVGTVLDVLTGLGNGYDLVPSGDKPLLLGGGVGGPPLYNLAKSLIERGKKVTVVLGFNTKDEIFYEYETLTSV